jgi:geranylgeranyl reductase family protein
VSTSEVLIVGGGPAGCVAGILLARKGIRTTILEKTHSGHRKICGDLLGARSLQFLDALNIEWPSKQAEGLPIEGIQVHDEEGLRSIAYLEREPGKDPVGITLRRDLLDGFLQQKAAEAGCELLHAARFREFVGREDNALLCRVSSAEGDRLFSARIVFGADGAGSTTARRAGLFARNTECMLLAVRGYYRGIEGLRNTIELYPLSGLQPGYAWIIPLSSHSANVGLGVRADVCSRDRVRLQAELRRFICEHPGVSKRMKKATPEGPLQGWPLPAYGYTRKLSGPHVLLLGDAGGFIDPLSGEGIFGAMQSAWMAAEVAHDAVRTGDLTGRSLSAYDDRCRRYFGSDFGSAAFVTGLLAHPPLGKRVAMWGLRRVEKNCLMDPDYARMIAGFFTGLYPRKRFLKLKWLARTLFV